MPYWKITEIAGGGWIDIAPLADDCRAAGLRQIRLWDSGDGSIRECPFDARPSVPGVELPDDPGMLPCLSPKTREALLAVYGDRAVVCDIRQTHGGRPVAVCILRRDPRVGYLAVGSALKYRDVVESAEGLEVLARFGPGEIYGTEDDAIAGAPGHPWIAQDVFSSGLPGPGFTVHETREAAEAAALSRGTAVAFQASQCFYCLALLGLERKPVGGGCGYCR